MTTRNLMGGIEDALRKPAVPVMPKTSDEAINERSSETNTRPEVIVVDNGFAESGNLRSAEGEDEEDAKQEFTTANRSVEIVDDDDDTGVIELSSEEANLYFTGEKTSKLRHDSGTSISKENLEVVLEEGLSQEVTKPIESYQVNALAPKPLSGNPFANSLKKVEANGFPKENSSPKLLLALFSPKAEKVGTEEPTISTEKPTIDHKGQDVPLVDNDGVAALPPGRKLKIEDGSQTPRPESMLEDDFFSMAIPVFTEKKKKIKKKKKRKAVQSNSSSVEPNEELNPTSSKPLPVAKISSSSTDQNIVEPPAKKSRFVRPITPPPVDDEEFKRKYMIEHISALNPNTIADNSVDDDSEKDENDKDDTFDEERYRETLKRLQKVVQHSDNSSETGTDYTKSQKRKYLLKIISFLPGSEDSALDIKVKGGKKISEVMEKALDHLRSVNEIPDYMLDIYTVDNIVLYWSKLKILPFMRVDSLNIPEDKDADITSVDVGLYTKLQSDEIEEQFERERKQVQAEIEREAREREEERAESNGVIENRNYGNVNSDDEDDDEKFKDLDHQFGNSVTPQFSLREQPDNGSDEKNGEGYFKIGLKADDNQKIIVKVNADTKIANLVSHYLSKSGLPMDTKLKLVFDDEEIDQEGTVGDTELEEDFTIDVYQV